MPSDTVMVLKRTPLPPAASAPLTASRASSAICMLHGVTLAHVEAMPICGLLKSASWKPTARNIAREGACLIPSTTSRELARASTRFFLAAIAVEKPSRSLKLKVLPSPLSSQEYYGSGASLDSNEGCSHYDRAPTTRFRDALRLLARHYPRTVDWPCGDRVLSRPLRGPGKKRGFCGAA